MFYKLSCPVPKEQRPVNEYLELVQSNFFNWPILTERRFRKKLSKTFVLFFILALPVSNIFYTLNQSLSKIILLNFILTCFLMLLMVVRLLLGWNYIKQRLYDPTIFYEESGWYDGKIWVKSKNILLQDRLIRAYQVLPAVRKLNQLFILILCLLGSFILLFIFN